MEYIQEMRDILYALDSRIQRTKLNVENVRQLMEVAGFCWLLYKCLSW